MSSSGQDSLTAVTLFVSTVILYHLWLNNSTSTNTSKRYSPSIPQDDSSSSNSSNSNRHEGTESTASIDVDLSKEEVMELRKKHFCSKVSVSYANSGGIMMVGGYGSRLIDETGQEYLDTRNNVAHCGHAHPRVVAAVQEQVARLNTNTRYLHPNMTLLAQRLANVLPDPLEVVWFVNSGSEANDLALRLARAATGSSNTIVVEGGYHGHTMAVLEVSPYKYEHSREFEPLVAPSPGAPCRTPGRHIWKVPAPNTYRKPMEARTEKSDAVGGTADSAGLLLEYYTSAVQEACDVYVEKRGEKVGAWIVEGGMSVAGVVLPPPGYLATCAAYVRRAGGVYIADEVQTGFGRLGTCQWAFQYNGNERGNENQNNHTGVVPDIVTLGKPFGNGMPLAAVVTTQAIAKKFEAMGVEYFNTFGGNPVCAAAGLAVLDVLESENLQERALQVGNYLKLRFRQLQERLQLIGDVRGSGLFLGIELVRNRDTLEPAGEETSFICTVLKEKYHILTSIDGPYENVLVVKPPMVFSKDDADQFVKCFEEAALNDLARVEDITSMSKTPT